MNEPEKNTADGSLAGKYLTFVLDGGHYGVGILTVREIIAMHVITPLPRLPEHIKGVINLRGKIIPVLDLRTRLGLHTRETDRSTCVIVLDYILSDHTLANVGCIVDTVSEVADIGQETIQAPPSFGNGIKADYIQGLANCREDERVITLLNTKQILSSLLDDEALLALTEEASASMA